MVNWQTSGDSMGLAEMLALLNRLRGHASALGCRINPSSRVAIFERNLRRFSKPGYDPRRDADFDPAILAHGTRDVRELTFICDKLVPKDRAKVRTALPDLLSGSITGEGRNQTARNLQFELFIAAQLAHSGFTVTLEEPDMVFVHEGTSLAGAAKRGGSGGQVGARDALERTARAKSDRISRGGRVVAEFERIPKQQASRRDGCCGPLDQRFPPRSYQGSPYSRGNKDPGKETRLTQRRKGAK